ncbi:patatin-like phospholipase domain containing 7-like [Candidatus Vecturithrix granuli]|uniref:Patatin-like phospholipase domain containing 7-like n=1 Tax=Vecturithrix granuli TaxID=1499967 RepID=A0A081C5V9_VECG1|nr:patatin-like phospholipase domain containing 7-like [Candidatus Vecturithrix granuli]
MSEFVFSNRNKYYILCVDDDQSVLNQLVTQLEEAFGDLCLIESAESAEEALSLFEEISVARGSVLLVISDQVMPGMKGDRFLELINTRYPGTHKILLTGYAGLESAMYAINYADLDKYIEKPWDKEEFLATVQRLLGPILETRIPEGVFRMREALQNVLMFRDLPLTAIDLIAEKLQLVQFPKDTFIFSIDDPADCMFIIKSGEVKVIAGVDENDEVLAYLGRGSYFGEMALLTGEPRSATIMTSLDTELFMLTKRDFEYLLAQHPSIAVALSHVLSQRLRDISIKKAGRQNKIICVLNTIVQSREKTLVVDIARRLVKETNGKVVVLESGGESPELLTLLNLKSKHTASHWVVENIDKIHEQELMQILPGDMDGVKFFFLPEADQPPLVTYIIQLLSLFKEFFNFVLINFSLTTSLDPGMIKTMEQASTILYVMKLSAEDDSEKSLECLKILHREYAALMKKVEIVVVRDTLQQAVPESLYALIERHHLHYLRLAQDAMPALFIKEPTAMALVSSPKRSPQITQDVSRIARRLGNVSVGLVLGGGGARAFAHLGILKVLREEKIPIDIIAGTSMGAFIGALHIMGKSVDEILDISYEHWKKVSSPVSWTLPRIAFIKGKRIQHIVHEIFGDLLIEDLPLPFFCVAGDLVSGQEVVIGQGKLYEAILATGALPGFFAPVSFKNMYLVDGGVVNNVPGDVLKKQGIDMVIAVDVTPEREVYLVPPIEQETSAGTANLFQKLIRYAKQLKFRYGSILLPRIIMRVMAMEGLEITRNKSRYFDIHIKPNLENFDLFDFKRLPQIVEIGEQTGQQQISKIRDTIHALKR